MEQKQYKAVIQLTKEQAIEFAESGAWKEMTFRQRAVFQMFQPLLCMPFDIFHEAVEKTLGRPVYTHEFGSMNHDGLMAELFEGKEPPTLQEIIEMIPAEKRIIISV
jgi:hypothetical protein